MGNIDRIRRISGNLGISFERVAYDNVEFYQQFHKDSGYASVKNRNVWAMYAIDRNANKWTTGPNETTHTDDRVCVAILSRPRCSLRAPDCKS